ncbi:34122_t:CDS:2, partial [Gigaspora margarita]
YMTLSSRLLEQKTVEINLKVNFELEKCNYLTLALDRWFFAKWKDYSKISQTEIFIANEIKTIIKTISINKFAGIVTDS